MITALGYGFKGMAEQRTRIDDDELKKVALPMFVVGISSQSVCTRCVSAEAIGRFAQAVGDPQVNVKQRPFYSHFSTSLNSHS